MELVIEAGAEDLKLEDDQFEIETPPEALHTVQRALEAREIKPDQAQIVMIPQNTVVLEGKKADQCLRLLEALEEHDDVQNVYANLEITDAA